MNWNQHYCLFNSQSSIRYIIQFCHTNICFFMFAKCSYLCFYFSSRWFCFRKWSMIITFSRWKIHSIFCSVIFFTLLRRRVIYFFTRLLFCPSQNFRCSVIRYIKYDGFLLTYDCLFSQLNFRTHFCHSFFTKYPLQSFEILKRTAIWWEWNKSYLNFLLILTLVVYYVFTS